MLLIRGAEVYAPTHIGKRDILVAGGKIVHMADSIDAGSPPCRVLDAAGKILIPGLIDQHVHITGGGGEGGYHTRTPEIQLSELIRGGITTVVGLLGTDGHTRSMEDLYAKTMALNEEGVTAFLMTGAYNYPGPTLTGDTGRDILFCEKVLGAKVALSDHRSSGIGAAELIELGCKTRVAGMLSGKPGMVILHMGNGKNGLQPVFDALEASDLPVTIFRPTHVGRNKKLREEAYKLLELGGWIDFTCGSRKTGAPGRSLLEAVKRDLPTGHITVSSDGHGSWSRYDEFGNLLEIGVAGVDSMLRELRCMVLEQGIDAGTALPCFTSNVADALGLSGQKGVIQENADADMLLLDSGWNLQSVIAKGDMLMENRTLLRKGTYE